MSRSYVPPRGPDGKILIPGSGFAALLNQSMQDVAPDAAATPDDATPVSPPRRAQIAALVAGLLIAVTLVALVRGLASTPPAAVLPLAAPAPVPTAELSTPPPRAAHGLPRAVVAYAAPNGDLIGAIEAGRAYTPTGTFGAGWLQIDVAQSGAVWVRASELPGAAVASLPDLRPPTPLPTVTAVPAPVIVWQPTPIPPVPTVCALATVGNEHEERCGYDLAALDAEAQQALLTRIGARAVSVTTATPLVLPTPVAAQTIR